MMLLYVLATPLSLAVRLFFLQIPIQIGLAFLSGTMMSIGSACFSPTIAKLTTQENRTFGFSLFIATGISSGAVAGMLGGFLPGLARRAQWGGPQVDGIKLVLLLACSIMLLAVFAMYRLHVKPDAIVQVRTRILNSFLLRFLISMGIWNFAIGFFIPFANGSYLSRTARLICPLMRIGEIFTISQLFQVAMVLLAPLPLSQGRAGTRARPHTDRDRIVVMLSLSSVWRIHCDLRVCTSDRIAVDGWSRNLLALDEPHGRGL